MRYRLPGLLLLALWTAVGAAAPRYRPTIEAGHPHDPKAFTQGLAFADGELYESTGLHGASCVRRVAIASGKVLAETRLDERYFGEGLAVVGQRLVQLTWKARRGFVYDRATLERLGAFDYAGEGWGLTYDGHRLIMSDGSDTLRFLDPETFAVTGRLKVHHGGRPVAQLNELEYIDGEIWANVWPTNLIVRIDPDNGAVTGIIDAGNLKAALPAGYRVDVLNGIAYDAGSGRLFMTGKWWPRLFEVGLEPDADAARGE